MKTVKKTTDMFSLSEGDVIHDLRIKGGAYLRLSKPTEAGRCTDCCFCFMDSRRNKKPPLGCSGYSCFNHQTGHHRYILTELDPLHADLLKAKELINEEDN